MVSDVLEIFKNAKISDSKRRIPMFFAPIEPVTANPILRHLMGHFGAQIVSRPKIMPQHLLKAKKWQFWQKIENIRTLSTIQGEKVYDGIQLIARPDDPIKPTLEFISSNSKALGIDYIDLNFCCPGYKILPQRRGGELLKHPDLILKVIEKVIKYTELPISMKIRKGYTENETPSSLLKSVYKNFKSEIAWISVNRAPVKMQGVNMTQIIKDVSAFQLALEAVDEEIPIVANGGIDSLDTYKNVIERVNVQGIMIARGALGNPTLFSKISQQFRPQEHKEDFTKMEDFQKGLLRFLEISQLYSKGNKGRWTTIGELKRQLFYFLKYKHECQKQQLPSGMGFSKWNKTKWTPHQFKQILLDFFPEIPSNQWKDWYSSVGI